LIFRGFHGIAKGGNKRNGYGHGLSRMGSGYMLELKDVLGIWEVRDKGFGGCDQNIIFELLLRSVFVCPQPEGGDCSLVSELQVRPPCR
jgi:hypothetical protein